MNHCVKLYRQATQNKGKILNNLEWRDGDFPVSTRFDDPYYSVVDGQAETDHVFIKGNRLNERWPTKPQFTIAELGFGTGLNFLETVRQWQAANIENGSLYFVSFEQYPMTTAEMKKALSRWQTLAHLSPKLIDQWRPENAQLEIQLTENIILTVHMGDANTLLPTLNFKANAWYLDGFSPAKNPELWNEKLMLEVSKHTAAHGTFATYTAAGFVRRGLEAAGFEVQKTMGFGRKRDMLIGQKHS